MRITAGCMRSRIVPVADIAGLRPTPSKVRQALFNILGSVDDFSMLDLYAGSGIMALEALSRGAKHAISIDQHRKAAQAMQQVRDQFKLHDSWQIQPTSVVKGIAALAGASFDIVFADPPYAQGEAEKLPDLLDQYNIQVGQCIIEESSRYSPIWPQTWKCTQSRPYGDTCLHFLLRK